MKLFIQRLLEDLNASLNNDEKKLVVEWQRTGQTVIYLILDNKVEGIIGVTEKIKKTSANAIQELQKMGVKVILLTGNNAITAKSVADELHLDDFKIAAAAMNFSSVSVIANALRLRIK